MEDEALSSILNLLQGSGNNSGSATNNTNNTNNNNNAMGGMNSDLQGMLLKMLLSGGFNSFLSPKPRQPDPEPTPVKPRTINLENYKRLD